jgi:hypothetical protein
MRWVGGETARSLCRRCDGGLGLELELELGLGFGFLAGFG